LKTKIEALAVVKIFQGPGNQMFQYAYALGISKRIPCEILLDTSWYDTYSHHRPYILDRFHIDQKIATKGDVWRAKGDYSANKLSYACKTLRKWIAPHHKKNLINERKDRCDLALCYPYKKAYITGYFTSEKFFQDITSDIRNSFVFKNELSLESIQVKKEMQSCSSVAISFRRGDFVNNPLHDVCSINYYKRAIAFMQGHLEGVRFFVFSDDILWVKENVELPKNSLFMDFNGPNYMEDMHLMTMCKHHIIPNSTFSWWGAWLSSFRDQVVVAPKRWLNGSSYFYDHVVPERWIKLDN